MTRSSQPERCILEFQYGGDGFNLDVVVNIRAQHITFDDVMVVMLLLRCYLVDVIVLRLILYTGQAEKFAWPIPLWPSKFFSQPSMVFTLGVTLLYHISPKLLFQFHERISESIEGPQKIFNRR